MEANQEFKRKWVGSTYFAKLLFGDVSEGRFCEIAFNFRMTFAEQDTIANWVWKQRRKCTWEQIVRLLQVEYQDKGDVVHRVVERKKVAKVA